MVGSVLERHSLGVCSIEGESPSVAAKSKRDLGGSNEEWTSCLAPSVAKGLDEGRFLIWRFTLLDGGSLAARPDVSLAA